MQSARAEVILMVETLTAEELDSLPVGVIQLDRDGTVLQYNETESALARTSRADVLGRDFFNEVAPCTAVRDFQGRFQDGVARRELDVTFDYRFRFRDDRVKDVSVSMSYRPESDTVWVVVERP